MTTSTFTDLALPAPLVQALADADILTPTPVQSAALPVMLAGGDLMVQAHTGSGKTLAYLLPLLTSLDVSSPAMQALILAPTHELVMQIAHLTSALNTSAGINLNHGAFIGEANLNRQIDKLKTKPQLLIGTPGRIVDLLAKRKINAQTIKTIVLDEVDNLLDNTNRDAVLNIIKATQRDRRLAAFSASLSDYTVTTLKGLMQDPTTLLISERAPVNPNISHYYLLCEQRDKPDLLRKLLSAADPARALIFLNDGNRIDLLVDKLTYHQYPATGLYGNLTKAERQKALQDFKRGMTPILVSSDLAARGLDIPDISHIINMDFPLDAHEYIHRAGRTARGDASGACYSIVNPSELAALRIYQREFHITVDPVHLVKGKILPGERKQFYKKEKGKK